MEETNILEGRIGNEAWSNRKDKIYQMLLGANGLQRIVPMACHSYIRALYNNLVRNEQFETIVRRGAIHAFVEKVYSMQDEMEDLQAYVEDIECQ